MIEVYRWRQLDRWDAFTIPHLHIAPHLPQKTIGELLSPRHERVDRAQWPFDQLQPITIHFGGDISRRKVAAGTDYTMPLFWAKPGDVVLSKIDLKNGAVGVLPEGWDNAVVTSHFKVYEPDLSQLDPRYFRMLLQTHDFKKWLWANRSGADGRTEVKLDVFEALNIPLPPLTQQQTLCDTYTNALKRAVQLEQEAEAIERAGWQTFETALGVAPQPPLPDRPVFVASFKDVERWSHESILRSSVSKSEHEHSWPLTRLGDLVADLENGWSPKCHNHPARDGKWGVLKLGAVSFGTFNAVENKELPTGLKPRPEYEVEAGDVLISRANVVRYVGACAYVEATPPRLLLCDKIFRVRFRPNSQLLPRFLTEAMKLRSVREHIESRLTGTSPTMKNISKPALLDIRLPLPDLATQQRLVDDIATSRTSAASKRASAATLRQSAWHTFESALFTASGEPVA
ncbi:restriction endonuclease subunit S [Pseudomonas aeruginosa]|uniref:restriction endonuclease subunit S n=1 Tax=Pseudomonas aeruginosa TaxID=287 RepID=UPI002E2A68CB|nr:restriction endonuclease subunit S [Pseudomonas aeruginosa]